MATLDALESQIRDRLTAASGSQHMRRAKLQHAMEEHEQRSLLFAAVASRLLGDAIRPRMEVLVTHFPNARLTIIDDMTTRQCACGFDRTPEFPASTTLTIGVAPDSVVASAVISYSLEILPVFIEFERQDQLVLPLDKVDVTAVASWLDGKVLSFVDTYLKLQTIDQYQRDNFVIDPVCGMRINRADAGASADYRGKQYHFCVEACRERFLTEPERYLGEHV